MVRCEVMKMICPDCKSEMSKKWQARSAGDVALSSGLVWSCGVCGSQLTLADVKANANTEPKAEHEPVSNLVTLPRPESAVTPWAPRDERETEDETYSRIVK
jgi:RNase P subunit RPR2